MAQNYPARRGDVPPTDPNRPAVQVEVTGQTRTFGADPQGKPVPGYDVQFRTASGQLGAVFVPAGPNYARDAQAAVAQHAAALEAVKAFTG